MLDSGSVIQLLPYFYGGLVAVALPHLFLRPIQHNVWCRVLRHNGVPEEKIEKDIVFLPVILGAVERILYTISILAGQPGFIGVWLAIKVAGGWNGWSEGREYKWEINGAKCSETVPGPQVFAAHLIGTALSVLFAIVGAFSISWLLEGHVRTTIVAATSLVVGVGALALWARYGPATR